MKYRKRMLFWIVALAAGALFLFLFRFHQTLYGLYIQHLARWREDAFVGKSVSELESALDKHGEVLTPVASSSFYTFTGKRLEKNQRAMQFIKGKEYRLFYIGSASNVGFVLIEKGTGGERVIEIFHRCYRDTL
jgi:hypothetical protein